MIRNLCFKLLLFTIINCLHAHFIRNIDDNDHDVEYFNDAPRSDHKYIRYQGPDFDEEVLETDDVMEEVRKQIRSALRHRSIARYIHHEDHDNVEDWSKIQNDDEDWSKMNLIADKIRRLHRSRPHVQSSSVHSPNIESEWGQNRRSAIDSHAGLNSIILNPNNMNEDVNGMHTLWKPNEEEFTSNDEWKPIRIHRTHTINVGKTDINPLLEPESEETAFEKSTGIWKHMFIDPNEFNLDKIDVNKVLYAENEDDSNEAWMPKDIKAEDTDSGIIDINTLLEPEHEITVSHNRWKHIKIDSDNINSGNIGNTLLESDDDETVSNNRWKILKVDSDDIEPTKTYSHSNKINVKNFIESDNKEMNDEGWKLLTKDSRYFISNDVLTNDDIQQIKLLIEGDWDNLNQEVTFESFKTYWLKLLIMVQNLRGHTEENQRYYLLWLLENMKKAVISNPEYLNLYLEHLQKNMPAIELNHGTTNLIHKSEQIPTNKHVSTMLPKNELIRKICAGVNQNLEDFWKIFYTYFGKNTKDTDNLQDLEKIYLILTIFTQFNQARQLGLPVEEYVDKIIKIISPDIQSLGPTIFNFYEEPHVTYSKTGCLDCNKNKIKDIINGLIQKETITEATTLTSKISNHNKKYIPNEDDKWQVLGNKNLENMDISKPEQGIETVTSVPDTIYVDIKMEKPTLYSNNQEANTVKPLRNSEKTHNAYIIVRENDWKKNLPKSVINAKTVKPMIDDLEAKTFRPMRDSIVDKPIPDFDDRKAKTLKPMSDLDNIEATSIKIVSNLEVKNGKSTIDLHGPATNTEKTNTDLEILSTTDFEYSEAETIKPTTDFDNLKAKTVKSDIDLDNSEAKPAKPMTDVDNSEINVVKPFTDLYNSKAKTVQPMTVLDNSESKTIKPMIDVDNVKGKNVKPIIDIDYSEIETVEPLKNLDNLEETVNPMPDFNIVDIDVVTTLKPTTNIILQHSSKNYLNENNEWNLEELITLKPDPDTIQMEDVLNDANQVEHTPRAQIINLKKYDPDLREEDIKKILDNDVPVSADIKREEIDLNDFQQLLPLSSKQMYNLISTNPAFEKFIRSNAELPKIIRNEHVVQPDSYKLSYLPEIENQILTKDILTDKNNPIENVPISNRVYHYILEKTPVLHPRYDFYDPYQSVDVHEKPNATESKSDIKIKSEITSLDQISNDSVEFVSHIIVMYFRNLLEDLGLDILLIKLDFGMIIKYLTQMLVILIKSLASNGISLKIIIKVIVDIQDKLRLFQLPELATCLQKVYLAVVDIIKSVIEIYKQNLTE